MMIVALNYIDNNGYVDAAVMAGQAAEVESLKQQWSVRPIFLQAW